jgi:hypothetical protein
MGYFKNYSESRTNGGAKTTQTVAENGRGCKFAIRSLKYVINLRWLYFT